MFKAKAKTKQRNSEISSRQDGKIVISNVNDDPSFSSDRPNVLRPRFPLASRIFPGDYRHIECFSLLLANHFSLLRCSSLFSRQLFLQKEGKIKNIVFNFASIHSASQTKFSGAIFEKHFCYVFQVFLFFFTITYILIILPIRKKLHICEKFLLNSSKLSKKCRHVQCACKYVYMILYI